LPRKRAGLLDERGAVRDFSTTDRFVQDPNDPKHAFVRTRWSTPIEGWQTVNGRQVVTGGRAIWHLPEGDFVYAEMKPKPGSLAFDAWPSGRGFAHAAHADSKRSSGRPTEASCIPSEKVLEIGARLDL
jgi:hypothetical protein